MTDFGKVAVLMVGRAGLGAAQAGVRVGARGRPRVAVGRSDTV